MTHHQPQLDSLGRLPSARQTWPRAAQPLLEAPLTPGNLPQLLKTIDPVSTHVHVNRLVLKCPHGHHRPTRPVK